MMKKINLFALLILMMILAITGCSKSKSTDTDPPAPPPPDINMTEAMGIYIGQIDSSSIEINVDNKDVAFRLSDKLRDSFASLNLEEGQMVKIFYFENEDNQLILQELTALANQANPQNSESKKTSGVYVGEIDNNSIEIKLGSEAKAFWVKEELKSSEIFRTLKEGDRLQFEYYTDEYERSVITTITKQ